MKRLTLLFATILAIALTSCHKETVTIRTEHGYIIEAVPASYLANTYRVGDSVTVYTATFDMYIIAVQRTHTKNDVVNGRNVYVLQGCVINR